MSQTLLEMTKALVMVHIANHHVQPGELSFLLHKTHAHLSRLQAEARSHAESEVSAPPSPMDWKRSITKHAVTCLECGGSFRMLSARHLRVHDLDSKSYRAKYGIPKEQHLSSQEATARRRALTQQIRPWEKARAVRLASKCKRTSKR